MIKFHRGARTRLESETQLFAINLEKRFKALLVSAHLASTYTFFIRSFASSSIGLKKIDRSLQQKFTDSTDCKKSDRKTVSSLSRVDWGQVADTTWTRNLSAYVWMKRDNNLIDFDALKQFKVAIWNINQMLFFIFGREFVLVFGAQKVWKRNTQKRILTRQKKKFLIRRMLDIRSANISA